MALLFERMRRAAIYFLHAAAAMSDAEDSVVRMRRAGPTDDGKFTVCTISRDGDTAPVLEPKKIADMATDGTSTSVVWRDGRSLWFHCVRGTTGANELASALAGKTMTGEVYIVVTEQDYSMMDFPADIFAVITTVHARRTPSD
jgi:hypothetical protein